MIDGMALYRDKYGDPNTRLEIVGAPANPQYFEVLEERLAQNA